MTSSRNQCFVYVWLPGETEAVTAGKYELTVDRRGTPMGRFVYGKSYLARNDAVPIDPVELTLGTRVFETTVLNGVFGALRDSGPDYWGRLVIERHLKKPNLDELTYLLESPDDRAGALGFGFGKDPPAPRRKFNKTLELAILQETADALLADGLAKGDDAEQFEKLMLLGTSMGGARPKAVVEDKDGLWLAKFNKPGDRWNNARVEHAMLTLARMAGITTAESKLTSVGDRDVLLVKRFDRDKVKGGYTRARMVSGITLLRTDDNAISRGRWSYVLLAEELRRVTAEPEKNAHELFRRMAFNALISNIDDHPRNHAILAKDREWKLSPAYDLTPANPISEEHRDLAMTAGDRGRWANAGNLLSQSARFLLSHDEASAIIDEVETVVGSEWYRTLKGQGVSEQDAETLKGAFAYPGFRLAGEQPVEAVVPEATAPSPSVSRKPAPRKASTRKRKKAS
ncbi:MAG: HipA domain-containing protein [Hyphomicrobium sp.]|nr:HipA domain-containing protein [Hyphomicrobium sp.]